MSFTYSSYVTTLANTLAVDPTNANFVTELPSIIDYAEQRIFRDLDLLAARVTDATGTATANSRGFTLPATNRFVVVDNIAVFTPVGSTTTRNPLTPVSVDYINTVWPADAAATSTTVPTVFAMVTDQTVLFGPPPGAAYTVEVIGTVRLPTLSASNQQTYLSQYLPDLFLAASMVFASGYQKNFGAQADDPKMAMSWEQQYQLLFKSANAEGERKRFAGASWTSKRVEPDAVPQRG